MMMITYMYYSYKGDQKLLLSSVRVLRKQTDDKIIIVDDGFNPMEKEYYDLLKGLMCDIVVSGHNRYCNLLGTEHTLYHARKMYELAPNNDDLIVKLDPDTIIFDLGWLKKFKDDKNSVLIGAFKQHINYMMGMCYAVKGGEPLLVYLHDVEKYPSWVQCLEDFEVSSRYYRVTDRDPHKITRIDLMRNNGWCLCDCSKFNPQEFAGLSVWNGGFGVDKRNRKNMETLYTDIADSYCNSNK
jgi:hypothetical protein